MATTRRSVDALNATMAEIFPSNREGLGGVYRLKPEISSNTQLVQLLQVHFESKMNTLHAMDALKSNLRQGRALILPISAGHGANGGEEPEKLKDLQNTFSCHLDKFKLVSDQQAELTLLNELRLRKHNLEDNLKRIKGWKKAWNIGLWIAKLGVTVFSVVSRVMRLGAAATASTNGAGGVISLIQPLVDSNFDNQQRSCEDEIDLTEKILNEAPFVFDRVNGVRVLTEHLVVEMGLLTQCAELPTGEDEDSAVMRVLEKIKRKAEELVESIQGLEEEVGRGSDDLRRAALTLLQTITHQVRNYWLEELPV